MTKNKKTENNNINSPSKRPIKKQSIIFLIVFVIGMVTIAALYLNINQLFEKTHLPNAQEQTQPQEQQQTQEIQTQAANASSKFNQTDNNEYLLYNCNELPVFLQTYYNFKLHAEQGQDYSNQLLALRKYEINSEEIKQIFSTLANLAEDNVKDDYFKTQFNKIIKNIYLSNQDKEENLPLFLREMIFIRPIKEKAIEKGGLDMEIALTEKALSTDDLDLAKNYMEKITKPTEELNLLIIKIQKRLTIKNCISSLDNIFATKLNCNIMSK